MDQRVRDHLAKRQVGKHGDGSAQCLADYLVRGENEAYELDQTGETTCVAAGANLLSDSLELVVAAVLDHSDGLALRLGNDSTLLASRIAPMFVICHRAESSILRTPSPASASRICPWSGGSGTLSSSKNDGKSSSASAS